MALNFGTYFLQKREERGILLREMAQQLGISAPYLTDVEHGRRNPFDLEKLTKAMDILELSKEERDQMLDLAGESRDSIAPDLPGYIRGRGVVAAALRTARDLEADDEDWETFIAQLKKKKSHKKT